MPASSLKLTNNGLSTLASAITSSSTSITVATGDGSKFPALSAGQYFMLTLVKSTGTFEIVKVTARSGDVLTVVRAQEGTTAADFSASDRLEHRLTAGTIMGELARIDEGNFTSVTDQYGNIRAVPQSGSSKTSSYTLATADVGRFIQVGAGGSITIPNSTFAAGDVVSIFNNTAGNITVTCSTTNAYIGGTDTNKTSVTLATRGVATVLFVSGTLCLITGNVT